MGVSVVMDFSVVMGFSLVVGCTSRAHSALRDVGGHDGVTVFSPLASLS